MTPRCQSRAGSGRQKERVEGCSRVEDTAAADACRAACQALMKRQIRDQWKDIKNELKRCDTDCAPPTCLLSVRGVSHTRACK